MKKTPHTKSNGVSAKTGEPRRTDTSPRTSRPAKPGLTGAKPAQPTKPGSGSAKHDTAKPRRAETKTAPGRSSTQANAARRPTKPAPAKLPAQAEGAKPRRVGTKLTRLLSLNVAAPKAATPAAARHQTETISHANWLLYCRPGFEQDCAQEAVAQARSQRPVLAEQPEITANSGYAVVTLNEQALSYRELIFARQLIRLHHTIDQLPERDRLTPILAAILALPGNFSALWLEVPDTNDGKTLSAFIRRFQPLLEDALRERGRLTADAGSEKLPRLHIFFTDKSSALIGTSDPYNSAAAIMGIVRQSMPGEAPSRSTLKLAEAIEVFLDKSEQTRLLRAGMTAVDLGAAPGGWTWQMVRRGIRVTAVDNGDMKGAMAKNPLVEHLKQDGFKYAPRKTVDWLICDMVEKPAKVAELIGTWFTSGWCRNAIFNLKLPMKQRVQALDGALGGIKSRLDMEGISYKMTAKQLYHDREEVTVFLSRTKNR
ncbi:MAG: 23S rRNA (cytidine(2498)-2'-O)-methyltransferase RlmM [Gallionella sp.]|nr:23S rRNA (cytidine(2498)-2'-O)-methyltransferase RlmM [Gallionella sp.]